jgi:uncharacterized protein (DUF3084 family)
MLFVTLQGLEPTNKAAQRAIRRAVGWRRTSFGSPSEAGSVFVVRMLSVVTSLGSENRPVLEFLSKAIRAFREGSSPACLLPQENAKCFSRVHAAGCLITLPERLQKSSEFFKIHWEIHLL